MVEETPDMVEPVRREKESWSAPEDSAEPFKIPEYKPLEPLEPALVDAMADSLAPPQNPDLNPYFEMLLQEPPQEQETRSVRSPIAVPVEACPDGLMGFCVNCPNMPCAYVKQRVLRALLTEVTYGRSED